MRNEFVLRLASGPTLQLKDGTTLRAEDLVNFKTASADGTFAEVSRNPNDPTVLGLKNLSQQVWTVTLLDGSQRQVESDRSIKLAAGTIINFGPIVCTIREHTGQFSVESVSGAPLLLQVGQRITTRDLLGQSGSRPIAEVSRNPHDPTVLGLKNLTSHTWTVVVPDGTSRSIAPGKNIKLVVGTAINFGGVEGKVDTAIPPSFTQFGAKSRIHLGRLLLYMAVAFLLGVGIRFLLGAFVQEKRGSGRQTLPDVASGRVVRVSINKLDFNRLDTITLVR